MKRTVINTLTLVFTLTILVLFKVYGDGMSLSQKAFILIVCVGILLIRILGELLYLRYVRKLLDTSAADAVPLWAGLKIIKDSEFACPNCGSHFKKKWWHYTFSFLRHRAIALCTFGKTNFRCPHCKKFDTCVKVHKD